MVEVKPELVGEEVVYQSGSYRKVRRYWRGIHPALGVIVRGWSGWDSSEDVIFTAIYGAGGAFAVFSEVAPGSPVLLVSASDVLPVLCMAGFHLFCGVYLRWPT